MMPPVSPPYDVELDPEPIPHSPFPIRFPGRAPSHANTRNQASPLALTIVLVHEKGIYASLCGIKPMFVERCFVLLFTVRGHLLLGREGLLKVVCGEHDRVGSFERGSAPFFDLRAGCLSGLLAGGADLERRGREEKGRVGCAWVLLLLARDAPTEDGRFSWISSLQRHGRRAGAGRSGLERAGAGRSGQERARPGQAIYSILL